jgi:GT2 family glycosyltransferase
MTAGLVIVTRDSRAFIGRALAAVAAQRRRPDRVVVVDNASRDGTADEVTRAAAGLGLPVELVRLDANTGFAHANNRAVAMLGDCDVVALLNPDAFPEPAWLAELLAAAARHPDAASLASLLLRDGAPDVVDGAGDVYHVSGPAWRHGHGRPRREVPGVDVEREVFTACAAAALYRREAWLAAGGFDERFFCYMEDVDLGFRLRLAGHACWYVPDAVAYHMGSATAGEGSAFAVYHGHRNLACTFVRNMPAALFWRYLPAHLALTVGGAVWCAWRGRAGAYARAKRDALAALPALWRERRQTQASRVAAPASLHALMARTSLLGQARRRRAAGGPSKGAAPSVP